ncbi:MAG TPA: hypothetical protein VGN26_23225 [Armatimonadota bacterium]|jgi:hypothetical protein
MSCPEPINPKQALYIKLGYGGAHADECIREGVLYIGYGEMEHSSCLAGDWDAAKEQLRAALNCKPGALANHVRQVKEFYIADRDTLWVTIHNRHLYWCFAQPEVTQYDQGVRLLDRQRVRGTVDGWRNTDILGNPLAIDGISSLITRTHGYRGTICRINDGAAFEYLVRKINVQETEALKHVRAERESLVTSAQALIGNLHQSDFELLIDLLFRQAGWQRLSEVGGQMKDLDAVFLAPVTQKRYGVQVKMSADGGTLADWQTACEGMDDFERLYFAVQKEVGDLGRKLVGERFELLLPDSIARNVVDYGLLNWLIEKST